MSDTNPSLRKPIAVIVISVAALSGVKYFEGFKSEAYTPVVGDILTLGHGSTKHPDGTTIKPTDTITRQQAEAYLKHDLSKFESAIKKCVKVPLYQYEYDAYVSLTYNIGTGAFCNSTLVKKLNAYDYTGACKEILKWDKFKGKALKGLTIRRNKEYNTCIGVV